MKIAVAYDNGMVGQHFGHCPQFKLYTVDGGMIMDTVVIPTEGSGHSAVTAFLQRSGVNTAICGSIGAGAQAALSAAGKQSFFEKMLAVAEGKTEVSVVDGERSCFTYAPDLARATRELLEDRSSPGIYHLANSGVATWYEAAQELFRLVRSDVIVRPVSPDAFPRPAERPEYSELLNTKRPLLRDYREALQEFILK